MRPEDVLDYWFGRLSFEQWFRSTPDMDMEIAARFRDLHLSLARRCDGRWREEAAAMLAAVIVFDQFPRNIYRGTPLAFATDCLALALAEEAVERQLDHAVPREHRAFFYLPFEHSEDLRNQDRSVSLFEALGDPVYLDYAERHRDVIRRFGRFPHRNPILMRTSTEEEKAYLATPGAGF
ncbi:DUF924 family protein [Gellertiella hungarica]|uniref:Uncharacterized protein (DUF924 family) n=1 Tax=Gellertiella hungarica TaxID=1572859 RepID=A0A7W6J9D8_9HYPH|nr:DUF924 family protein [Gellertiella hungarica]MBB4067186.1 uncharacterized protein (DUF924 family) [Gellertiella hungarica]